VPGYSLDFERGLADYVVGLGGFLARRRYAKKAEDAIAKIDAPNERAYAQRYWDYTNKPGQELARMRQITFLYTIAGNVASAVTNASQVGMVTAPYLTQFVNAARASVQISRAYAEVLTMFSAKDWRDFAQLRAAPEIFSPDKAPADVRDALQEAWAQGIFLPLNVNDTIATAHETSKFHRGLGKKADVLVDDIAILFSGVERLNRLVTFIAAYRTAKMAGVSDRIRDTLKDNELAKRQLFAGGMTPEKFAKWAVEETQYVTGKLNRPEAFRGLGTAIFQFYGFTVQTVELMYRMGLQNGPAGKVALGLMLALIFAAAGLWGLPGADNAKDIVEWAYKKWTKLDLDIKTRVYEEIQRATGSRTIADAFNKGALSVATGIDWSQRLGLGDIIKTQNKGDTPIDFERMAGVNYDTFVKRPMKSLEAYQRGDTKGAIQAMTPNFMGSPIQSAMWEEGGIRSGKTGAVVIPAEQITKGQAALKALGFTPMEIAMRRERLFAQDRVRHDPDALRSDWYSKFSRAYAQIERAKTAGNLGLTAVLENRVKNLEVELEAHNAKVPDHEKIVLKAKTMQEKVRQEFLGEATRKTPKLARERVEEIGEAYGR
jgi:hypothetical protein